MALLNITVDGTSYIYRKNSAFEYVSGKLHKFTIEVSKKSESGLEFKLVGEDITPWESETITHDGTAREYVVINVPAASTEENISALKAAIEASGKDYTKIKNLKVTGEVNAYDFYFMRDEMTALQGINMKEVDVVEQEIPDSAFYGKSTLVRFVFPDEIIQINSYAFSKTNLTGALMLPNNITHIGYSAFEQCSSLTSLNLSNKIEIIGDLAFEGCSGFSNALYLPSTLVSIGRRAFNGCGFRGNLILPENLSYIGAGAFCGCGGFTGDLTIPADKTTIPSIIIKHLDIGKLGIILFIINAIRSVPPVEPSTLNTIPRPIPKSIPPDIADNSISFVACIDANGSVTFIINDNKIIPIKVFLFLILLLLSFF